MNLAHALQRVVQPEGWKPASGYANGLVTSGRMLFVAGQIGWTGDQVFQTDDFVGQTRQALANIVTVVEAAGGRVEHIARLTWFITDKAAYTQNLREIGAAYRDVMGRHFPTMSVVEVKALIEDAAKVEIEATAVLPD